MFLATEVGPLADGVAGGREECEEVGGGGYLGEVVAWTDMLTVKAGPKPYVVYFQL